ncbi:MAG TPA: adenosylcobinamide-phosphate synthase CbiB [Novosphingobium sp.]|nr:adenosylcobinamide-phosphate synthase CbiB [Novosphingobium sp.]
MVEPVALAALALDAAFGWPGAVYRRVGHPVGGFARLIGLCEARWNKPERAVAARRLLGVLTLLILLVLTLSVGALLTALCRLLPAPLSWGAQALLAWPALAQRSLHEHVKPVAAALARGDIRGARNAVSMIVGRDTDGLDEAGIARAAIESLAESFCDGVAAPVFWLLVGGLGGVWAYKAVNTADSLIGHREARWRAFGWAAARTDDLLNLVPARLGGLVLCMAGGGGWRIMWRDHARHASPNAGWTEAAMAGALGLRLAGPVAYDGIWHDKAWIGSGRAQATADDVCRALAVYVRACILLALMAAGIVWGNG